MRSPHEQSPLLCIQHLQSLQLVKVAEDNNINNQDMLFGREQELATLKATLKRAQISGKIEIICIEGPSGVGKAALVTASLKEQRFLLASSTFIRFARTPFDSILKAIDGLIHDIQRNDNLTKKLKRLVRIVFNDNEVTAFTHFVPMFTLLAENDHNVCTKNVSEIHASIQWNLHEVVMQFKSLLRTFLRLITDESLVVFSLFNIHWADTNTLELIKFIANDDEQSRLVIIATCCDGEVSGTDHLYNKLKDDASSANSYVTTVIQLSDLDLETLHSFLVEKFDGAEQSTSSMSLAKLVWARTNGNPFFVVSLLEKWQTDGLLLWNQSGWTWDLDKIRDTAITQNVVELVSYRLHGLPSNVQQMLHLAACLGFKFDPRTLNLLQTDFSKETPTLDISHAVDCALDHNLLELVSDGQLEFCNSEIYQATLCCLPDAEILEKLHLRIGLILLNSLQSSQVPETWLMIPCLDQIRKGYHHLVDGSRKLEVAELCHKAAVAAMTLSAYRSSSDFSERGIDILNELGNKWDLHHALSNKLLLNFSQTQYLLGHVESSMECITELLSHKPNNISRLQANVTRLRIIKSQSNLREFVAESIAFLEELGVNFPSSPRSCHVQFELSRTTWRLDKYSNDQLLELKHMTNPSIAVAVKVMNMMMVVLETLKMQKLGLLVACRAVNLCMTHGVCEDCAEALTLFGIFCIAKRGWLVKGYRLGELALKMSQKFDPTKVDVNVKSFVYHMTKPWQFTPMSHCVSPMFDCYVEAMKRCDPAMAFLMINHYFALSFFSSLNLDPLLKDIQKFSDQMLEYGQKMIYLQTLPIWQCVLNLSGMSFNVVDVENGTARDRQHQVGNADGVGQQACWSFSMQIAVYVGNWDLAADLAARLEPLPLGITRAHVFYPARVFFFGLIAIQRARVITGKGRRRDRQSQTSKHMAQIQDWVKKKALNLKHKLLILEAEHASLSCTNGLLLQKMYDLAISKARRSGYIQDGALAAQLAAGALQRFDETREASTLYLFQAHDLWIEWGAHAIASKLADDYPMLMVAGRRKGEQRLSRERYSTDIAQSHRRTLK